MLGPKTIQVEQNIDAVLTEVKAIIVALKSGKTVGEVALRELLQLSTVVAEIQGSVEDFKDSMPAAIRTVLVDAEDLVTTILGIPDVQPL